MFHLLVVERWEVLFLIFFFRVGIYIFTLYVQGDFLLSSFDPKLVRFKVKHIFQVVISGYCELDSDT